MLTLYIIPGGKTTKENFIRSAKSWGEGVVTTVHVIQGDFDKLKPTTKWKAFIYSDEEVTDGLMESLPIFLDSDDWDFFTLYREALDGKCSQAPRIYRSEVVLAHEAPYPKNLEALRGTWILNGMIKEQK